MELSDRPADLAKARLAPIIGLVVCLPGAVPALAQTAGLPPGAAPGAVLEQVTTLADTAERYALYLPSGYRVDRTWPVLYLLEDALVRTGGDYPREYLARSKPAHALLMLDIAQAIRPEDAGRCRRRAQALTQMGKATEAAGLACAL